MVTLRRQKDLNMTITEVPMDKNDLQRFNRWIYDVMISCTNQNEYQLVKETHHQKI